jgi:hypothetical protein
MPLDFFLHVPPRDDSSHSAQGGLGQLRQEELWAISTEGSGWGGGARPPWLLCVGSPRRYSCTCCSRSPCSCTGRPRRISFSCPTCSRTSTTRAENRRNEPLGAHHTQKHTLAPGRTDSQRRMEKVHKGPAGPFSLSESRVRLLFAGFL